MIYGAAAVATMDTTHDGYIGETEARYARCFEVPLRLLGGRGRGGGLITVNAKQSTPQVASMSRIMRPR